MGHEQNSQQKAGRLRAPTRRRTRVRRPRPAPPRPRPSRSCRVPQHSREPSRFPRLPRSKGPGQIGKSQVALAPRRLQGARTTPSLQGAGRRRIPPLNRSPCDRFCLPSLSLPGGEGAGLGREGAWPRGPGSPPRSSPRRESQVGRGRGRVRAASRRSKARRARREVPRLRGSGRTRVRCSARCLPRSPAPLVSPAR